MISHRPSRSMLATIFAAMIQGPGAVLEERAETNNTPYRNVGRSRAKADYHHPTKRSREETKTRRKMAAKSRKINRRK